MSQVLNAITKVSRYIMSGKTVSIVTDISNGPSTLSGTVVSETANGLMLTNTLNSPDVAMFIPWTSIQYITFNVPKVD